MGIPTGLYSLQKIDLEIDNLKLRLAEIEASLGETSELLESRERVVNCQKEIKTMTDKQKDMEFDTSDVQERVKSVKNKLYSGKIRNPKELENLQADLNYLEPVAEKREDELLQLLLEIEDAQVKLADAESNFSHVESEWERDQGIFLQEKESKVSKLSKLEKDRLKAGNGYDSSLLKLYDRLREMKSGRAVTTVQGSLCSECRISLPTSVLKKARTGQALVQCVSCERIIDIG